MLRVWSYSYCGFVRQSHLDQPVKCYMIGHAFDGDGHFFFGFACRVCDADAGKIAGGTVFVSVTNEMPEYFFALDTAAFRVHRGSHDKKSELITFAGDDLRMSRPVGKNIC